MIYYLPSCICHTFLASNLPWRNQNEMCFEDFLPLTHLSLLSWNFVSLAIRSRTSCFYPSVHRALVYKTNSSHFRRSCADVHQAGMPAACGDFSGSPQKTVAYQPSCTLLCLPLRNKQILCRHFVSLQKHRTNLVHLASNTFSFLSVAERSWHRDIWFTCSKKFSSPI